MTSGISAISAAQSQRLDSSKMAVMSASGSVAEAVVLISATGTSEVNRDANACDKLYRIE